MALKNGEANGLNSSTSSGSTDGLPVEGDEGANDDDVPAKDFAICALDVLSGTYFPYCFTVIPNRQYI